MRHRSAIMALAGVTTAQLLVPPKKMVFRTRDPLTGETSADWRKALAIDGFPTFMGVAEAHDLAVAAHKIGKQTAERVRRGSGTSRAHERSRSAASHGRSTTRAPQRFLVPLRSALTERDSARSPSAPRTGFGTQRKHPSGRSCEATQPRNTSTCAPEDIPP